MFFLSSGEPSVEINERLLGFWRSKFATGFEAGQPKTPWQKTFVRNSEFAALTRTNCHNRIAFA